MVELYHFWSWPEAQRVRLALGYKGVDFDAHALAYDDDETFFELGVARTVPVLRLRDGSLRTDSLGILHDIDALFPDGPPLVENRIDQTAWQALLDWRASVAHVLDRLYAPGRPGFADIGRDAAALAAYKADVQKRFGMSLEELANDRYDGFTQFSRLSHLDQLARHLARQRFYMGEPSIADLLLAADLFPLQVLDGVSLPIDMMYYLQRVGETCRIDLEEGVLGA
ncbi:glutathione S-transferase N-terminal domain-containing protein [Acidihalobacter ferrooxydans]|uniref:Glutathione S-transferase n=1 Tax=Acidihalobacter ferrooxydans TaxID=1765967 RepID=A0A1P8UDE6_9GAMM|nr:glutathione S-transferase N-terminal domain-containing protein [Acidihalobacter ferrooxydans]APZ41865.1 glutathione S-transferase [Acidihalobacter ferrooxydans]